MIFWIDIDDTIADTDPVILNAAINFHIHHLGRPVPSHDIATFKSVDYFLFARYLEWDESTVRSFFRTCYPDYLKDIPLKAGAKDAINYLRANGHRVILLSSRRDSEYHGSPMLITRQWLTQNELEVDDVVLDCVDKANYLRYEKGGFIDDSFDNCTAMIGNPRMTVFQYLSPFRVPCRAARIHSISSWDGFLHLINRGI